MRISAWLMAVAVIALVGCQEDSTGPTTGDLAKEREALKQRLANRRDAKKPTRPAPAAAPAEASAPTFTAGAGTYEYDTENLRDPFRSFEWERPDRLADDDLRGPLEQYDLAQLSLIAVVWATGNARALVQDPSGASYIVGQGARIGKNQGRVIDIGDNRLVVKETYVDFLGQETTKDIELRIRRSQGG